VRVSDRLALGVHELDAGAAAVSPAPTFGQVRRWLFWMIPKKT
jgi:hypothetical protein